MLIDRRSLAMHRPWIIFTTAMTGLGLAWYGAERLLNGYWPGGSSLPGFTLGVLGGLIILFEALLWLRKKKRAWRVGRAQVWMRSHIWLGLLCVPLLILHSGFRWGGSLSTALMILLLLVVASGVWGLAMQQYLPRRMLQDVPAETIYSQIGRVVDEFRAEAARLVTTTCGPGTDGDLEPDDSAEEAVVSGAPHLVVGAVRTVGKIQGKVLLTRSAGAPVPGSESLRLAFRQVIAPFLTADGVAGSPLREPSRAAALFRDLRAKLDPAAHEAVAAIESLCDQRRQLQTQTRLHFWLHNWLWIHLPLTAALLVLMFAHVWVALKYW